MKQMFDISEKLITEQSDEISGISTSNWEDSSWKGLRVFRFCIMPWKDEREPTIKYCMGRQIDVVQVHQNTEL